MTSGGVPRPCQEICGGRAGCTSGSSAGCYHPVTVMPERARPTPCSALAATRRPGCSTARPFTGGPQTAWLAAATKLPYPELNLASVRCIPDMLICLFTLVPACGVLSLTASGRRTPGARLAAFLGTGLVAASTRLLAGPPHSYAGRAPIVGAAAKGYEHAHNACCLVINFACTTLGGKSCELQLAGRLTGVSSIACPISDHQPAIAVGLACKCGALSSTLPLSCARARHSLVKWP